MPASSDRSLGTEHSVNTFGRVSSVGPASQPPVSAYSLSLSAWPREVLIEPVDELRESLPMVSQPCPAPGLTTSFVSTPAFFSFSTISSDCWSGTS